MIHYQIKKYIDNGHENSLQIEIILNDSFNNKIIDVDGSHDDLLELYILLNSDDLEMIENRLNELLEIDDIETLAQLSQKGEI